MSSMMIRAGVAQSSRFNMCDSTAWCHKVMCTNWMKGSTTIGEAVTLENQLK